MAATHSQTNESNIGHSQLRNYICRWSTEEGFMAAVLTCVIAGFKQGAGFKLSSPKWPWTPLNIFLPVQTCLYLSLLYEDSPLCLVLPSGVCCCTPGSCFDQWCCIGNCDMFCIAQEVSGWARKKMYGLSFIYSSLGSHRKSYTCLLRSELHFLHCLTLLVLQS